MKEETIIFRNDGNYVTADGTTYVLKQANPSFGESDDEPEFITKHIQLNPNDAWVKAYLEDQHSWATSQEREEDERIDLSNVPVDAEEDPLLVVLSLVQNPKTNPEMMLGVVSEDQNPEKDKLVALLSEYKETLLPQWQVLLDRIYSEQMRISDIMREEEALTGKAKSNQAYSKQVNKAIEKLKTLFEAAGYEVDRTPKRKAKKNQN